jgi:hypothetical protein
MPVRVEPWAYSSVESGPVVPQMAPAPNAQA